MSDDEDFTHNDQAMPLIEHLTELRDRLLRILIALVPILAISLYFSAELYSFVSEPLRRFLPEGTNMIATEVASPFLTPFKLSMVVSLVVAMPYILFQVWQFIAPGMYRHEKRLALPLLASSIVLFYGGLAFAYYVVFPLVFQFFSGIIPAGITYSPDIARFLDVALKLFLAFGVAFEIPIATVLLIWAGITDPETLSQKRPYVFVACFVIGMLLTPPDVVSQCLLAIPMWLLFEAGLFFGRMFKPKDASPS